jgi:short-subunit dehydrogenase
MSVALVTGAAGGIGYEVAGRLIGRGYQVIAHDRTLELATDAARRLGGDTLAAGADLADRDEAAALVARVEGEWADDLAIVVANAGLVVPGEVVDLAPDQLDAQLDVMLRSAMHLIAAAARVFTAKDNGHILATVSMGGIIALPGSATYSAAKAGLRAYLAALNAELRRTNVHVSGIYPSAVDTPLLRHEATHDGSLLNWVGKVHSAADVANCYERALDKKRLEVYLPYSDSLLTKFVECYPWVVPPLLPVFNRIGRASRDRWMKTW